MENASSEQELLELLKEGKINNLMDCLLSKYIVVSAHIFCFLWDKGHSPKEFYYGGFRLNPFCKEG